VPDQPETEQPAKPKRTGRPSKASPQIFAKVLEGISLGLTIEQACALAGTSHDSFERWEKANPTLCAEAQARRIFLLIEKLQQDPKDWKRYAWML
jgi:hypothetical protein